MDMTLQLHERTAIVTGAGQGLGRAHALALARHGARVVLNDVDDKAEQVTREITQAGGKAVARAGDVTRAADMEELAELAVSAFGRVDILVNNAGILRDRSFAKMPLEDFQRVLDVHVMGAVNATRAVWSRMREQHYGRIVLTTSSSGLYGNFGQSNYSAAKMALVGLMQTLALEGASRNVRVNCLAPSALTGMTEGLLAADANELLTPERVSPGVIALVGEDAPTRMILLAGGGSYECAHITMTRGIHIGDVEDAAALLCKRMEEVRDPAGQVIPESGWEQPRHEVAKAGKGVE